MPTSIPFTPFAAWLLPEGRLVKISTRIILSHLVIIAAGFSYFVYWLVEDVRQRYLESWRSA